MKPSLVVPARQSADSPKKARGVRSAAENMGDWGNEFRLIHRDVVTGKILDDITVKNLVPYASRTAFLKWIQYGHASQGGSVRYCGLGSGETAPSYNDTTLDHEVYRKEIDTWDNDDIASEPPDGPKMIADTLFLAAEAIGNLCEVGLFQSPSGGTMFNRALFAYGAITDVQCINPVRVESSGHGRSAGDIVRVTGVYGTTELNGSLYTISSPSADTFALDGVDGTAYTAYESGGQWARIIQKTGTTTLNILATIKNTPS